MDEYNAYGQAQFTKRYRIDAKTASAMYRFQYTRLKLRDAL